MYSVRARHVIARYPITANMNLDGLLEFLDKKTTMTEFGALADIANEEEVKVAGQNRRDRSLRQFVGGVKCLSVSVSPAGNEFAFATPEGVNIFAKNRSIFAPIGLSEAATPANCILNLEKENYAEALLIALTLSENNLLCQIVEAIPIKMIKLLVSTLPHSFAIPALNFIARPDIPFFILATSMLKKGSEI